MSFNYNTPPSSYKPQVRVEGFHLPSPDTPPGSTDNHHHHHRNHSQGGPQDMVDDLFVTQGFMPPTSSDPFRKFPSSAGGPGDHGHHDFEDDLVSLMTDRSSSVHHHHHQQGSTGSSHSYDDYHHQRPPTHNIFDVSSPIPMNSGVGAANGGNGSQPGSLHSPSTSLHDYHHHHSHHFNSTLPALNSSMRFENPENNNPPPPPPPASSASNNAPIPLTPSSPHPPPSSYHVGGILPRHTPSPTIHAPGIPPITMSGRSRSRSRPPSQGGVSLPGVGSALSGGVGPARTTRQRRGNSISGTSPPPLGARPHAIVIPGRNGGGAQGPMSAGAAPGSAGGQQHWYMGPGPNNTSTSDYSLPTPESLTSHSFSHTSHPPQHSGYTPFSLSPPTGTASSTSSSATTTAPTNGTSNGNNNNSNNGSVDGLINHLPPLHANGAMGGYGQQQQQQQGWHGMMGGSGAGGSPMMTNLASPVISSSIGGMHGHHHHHATASIGSGAGLVPSSTGAANGVPLSNASATATGGNGAVVPGQDKQVLLANEKRRRRRESHNAVERRRRDNINEKISELATLIPECMLDGNEGPPNAKDSGASTTPPITEDALVPHGPIPPPPPNAFDQGGSLNLKKEKDDGDNVLTSPNGGDSAAVVKANKGMILRKSVEYIRYLQQLVTAQGARNRELEGQLRKYRGSNGGGSASSSVSGSGGGEEGDGVEQHLMHFQQQQQMNGLNLVDEDDLEDALDGDFTMNFGGMGMMGIDSQEMVSQQQENAGGNSKKKGDSARRKGHHKHSSSSGRLPSMPEEEGEHLEGEQLRDGAASSTTIMEVDDGSESKMMLGNSPSDQEDTSGDDGERGRTRGVRGGRVGIEEEGSAFGANGHHHQQQQQVQMGW